MSDEKLSQSLYDDAPLPETPKGASRWEDFIDIFYAPAQVFARRAHSGFGIPMLVVTVLMVVIFLAASGVMQPMMDAEFNRAMAAAAKKGAAMTDQQLQVARSMQEKFAPVIVAFIIPITMFCVGIMTWLVGKLFESKMTASQGIMVASYAYLPKIVEGLINSVQAMLLDPASMNGRYRLSLGVGRFFDPDVASPILLAIVGRIDVFTIWVTVLLVIGLMVTGKVPKEKAIMAGIALWIVGMLPGLLGALRA